MSCRILFFLGGESCGPFYKVRVRVGTAASERGAGGRRPLTRKDAGAHGRREAPVSQGQEPRRERSSRHPHTTPGANAQSTHPKDSDAAYKCRASRPRHELGTGPPGLPGLAVTMPMALTVCTCLQNIHVCVVQMRVSSGLTRAPMKTKRDEA